MMFLRSALPFAAACVHLVCVAQSTETQAWGDFTLGRNFASYYLAELEIGYQALIEGSPQWSTFSITPTLEASVSPHIDLISGFPWMDTQQNDDVRTREFRVQLGGRYHFLPYRKVQPRLTWRYEWRNFNTVEPEPATSQSDRVRWNAAVYVAWDKPLMSYDTVWYSFIDWEGFIVLDEQLDERYAHLSIGRVGVGRKFDYNWRLELIYALWHTRNEVDVERDDRSIDHVIRVSLKCYITPPNRRAPRSVSD